MTLKYYYLSVVLLCFAIGGYLFGVGMYQEPVGEQPAATAMRPAVSAEPEGITAPEPAHPAESARPAVDGVIGGPFPADVLPPEARLSTSSQPVVLE